LLSREFVFPMLDLHGIFRVDPIEDCSCAQRNGDDNGQNIAPRKVFTEEGILVRIGPLRANVR